MLYQKKMAVSHRGLPVLSANIRRLK